VDPLLVRFRQLKQDLMRIVEERDQLQQKAKQSEEREAAFLTALDDIVTQGALPGPSTKGSTNESVSERFGSFLDREAESESLRASQTSAEMEARRTDLNRYHRYNTLIVQAGLGADQGDRIEALRRAVEGVRVDDGSSSRSSKVGWGTLLVSAILGMLAGVSGSLLFNHRRRLPPPLQVMQSPVPIHRAKASRSDVDDHAA
jgi:hypothetical protein